MTALKEYQRLEGSGLWRETPDAQRREVVVSIGDATLVVSDMRDQALTHWSLAAVERLNPGMTPAIFSPDGLAGETLELGPGEEHLIDAIERIRLAVERRRPRPGRLRVIMLAGTFLAVAGMAIFWLPDALQRQALAVVPDVKRSAIGNALLERLQNVTGRPCDDPAGKAALARLAARLRGADGAPVLYVMRDGVQGAAHLPGGIILLNQSVVEDTEEPDVVAGFVIAEQIRAEQMDPLARLLKFAGTIDTFRFLTTGTLPPEALNAYAETMLTLPPEAIADETLLQGFEARAVRSSPYAYAVDVSGETVIGLIEADPLTESAPVLRDADWLRLQAICGG